MLNLPPYKEAHVWASETLVRYLIPFSGKSVALVVGEATCGPPESEVSRATKRIHC